MPCGNSVNRKRKTTVRSMRVVLFVFLSRPFVSSSPGFSDFIMRFLLLCSAFFMVLTSRPLKIVNPMQGTSLTRIAWIQKLKSYTNLSRLDSSLNETTQMKTSVPLLPSMPVPCTVIVTKFGMQTISVTT